MESVAQSDLPMRPSPSIVSPVPSQFCHKLLAQHKNMSNTSSSDDLDEGYSEDDGISHEIHETNDLDGIINRKKINLGIYPSYGCLWTREHGFREFFQNW
jgi:hypothetical protein